MRDVKWDEPLNDLPTQCSRKHETVEMINYSRLGGEERKVELKFFCPSCHQKLRIDAKKISGGRWAATGYEILSSGDI
jgi:hypothetical protein